MTQAAKQPSTATRRTGGSQPALNGHGPGEQDLRDKQEQVGDRDRDDGNDRDDRTERDERNSRGEQSQQRARREQDARREDRADDRDDRDDRDERNERDSRDEQSDQRRRTERGEQWHGDRGELGDGREPRREPGGVQRSLEQVTDRVRAATPHPVDAFAPTADMSKVLTAWFEMVGDMMKLQQQFFADMLGAGNTNDRTTTGV
jgi:hypothetical protein